MITVLFVAACILAVIVRSKKRTMERLRRTQGLAYSCLKISLEFLLPLIGVMLFYHLLLLGIVAASEFAGMQFLMRFEEVLAQIKSFLSVIELNPWEILVVFAGLYLLGLVRAFAKASERLRTFFERYQTAMRRVFITVVLLCSFTLLGTELGPPSDNLKLRIKTIREGYAEVCGKVEAALTEEIAEQLYSKAQEALPPAYAEAVTQADTIGNLVQTVREDYVSAQKEHGLKILPIQILIEAYSTKSGKVEAAEQVFKNMKEEAKKPSTRAPAIPPKTSYRDLQKAQIALNDHQKKFGARGIRFLQRNGAKELLGQLPSVATSRLKESMRALLASTPLGEALTEVIFNTIEDYSQTKIEEAVDNAAKSISENPRGLGKAIEHEASKVVSSTPVNAPKNAIAKANREIKRWQTDFEKFRNANAIIAREVQRVEGIQIDKLISRLNSSNEQTRTQAVQALSQKGKKLSKKQVDRLVEIMRRGEGTWSNYLYRQSHCTWYEEVSVKHYAADAIRRLDSPHVNKKIYEEAVAVGTRDKRRYKVTDPGWI